MFFIAEYISKRIFSLPMYPYLAVEKLQYIIDTLKTMKEHNKKQDKREKPSYP
jgi:dTDP-4-amino-4,6-dideoxygalactose transaminase